MRSILILGAGRSASSLIQYLIDHAREQQWRVTVADKDADHARKLTGTANDAAEGIALDATDAEKNAIQEVIGTISHINSSAQGQARESDELRILAEKNRQLLDELQGVLQTLLDSGRSKLQL